MEMDHSMWWGSYFGAVPSSDGNFTYRECYMAQLKYAKYRQEIWYNIMNLFFKKIEISIHRIRLSSVGFSTASLLSSFPWFFFWVGLSSYQRAPSSMLEPMILWWSILEQGLSPLTVKTFSIRIYSNTMLERKVLFDGRKRCGIISTNTLSVPFPRRLVSPFFFFLIAYKKHVKKGSVPLMEMWQGWKPTGH